MTEYQDNILGGRVPWFQKIAPAIRMEDGFVDEEGAARIWMMDNETSTKSKATA